MYRLVTGTIHHTTGQPWKGASVKFVRSPSTYTSNAHYPTDSVVATTDFLGQLVYEGEIGVPLWCNEGAISTEYKCFLPHDSFKFALPIGATPLTLEFLRELAVVPSNAEYPILKNYVDEQIANLTGGTANVIRIQSDSYISAIALSALKIVALSHESKPEYASVNNINHAEAIVGIVSQSFNINVAARAISEGTLQDNSWNWIPRKSIFLGVDGNITQSPTNGFFLKELGTALTSNKIYFGIQSTIYL